MSTLEQLSIDEKIKIVADYFRENLQAIKDGIILGCNTCSEMIEFTEVPIGDDAIEVSFTYNTGTDIISAINFVYGTDEFGFAQSHNVKI